MQIKHIKPTIENKEIPSTGSPQKLFAGREVVTAILPNGQEMLTVPGEPAPLLLNLAAGELESKINKILYKKPCLTEKEYLYKLSEELSLIRKELLKTTQNNTLSIENKNEIYETKSNRLKTIKESLEAFLKKLNSI